MPGLRVRKRSKRGLPEHLPDLTQPARGFGRDPESAEDDIDAEYHGVYTIRGAKIRPNTFVEAWLYDPKMDQHYTSVVYVTGASHHEGSETPSPHEMQLDIIYTIDDEQAHAHKLLTPGHPIEYLSTANDVPKESKVVYLTNWTETLDLTQVRDPVETNLLPLGAAIKPGCNLAGYAMISGSKRASDRKIRQHVRVGEDGLEGLLGQFPQALKDQLPIGVVTYNPFFIPLVSTISGCASNTADPSAARAPPSCTHAHACPHRG